MQLQKRVCVLLSLCLVAVAMKAKGSESIRIVDASVAPLAWSHELGELTIGADFECRPIAGGTGNSPHLSFAIELHVKLQDTAGDVVHEFVEEKAFEYPAKLPASQWHPVETRIRWDGSLSSGDKVPDGPLLVKVFGKLIRYQQAGRNTQRREIGVSEIVSSSFLVDTAAPQVTVLAPIDGSFFNHPRQAFEVAVEDSGSGINSDSILLIVAGAPRAHVWSPAAGLVQWAPEADLPEGWLDAAFEVRDVAGNLSVVSWRACSDRTPPEIDQPFPADGAWSAQSSQTISVGVHDALSGLAVWSMAVDGMAVEASLLDGRLSAPVQAFADGTVVVDVSAEDLAGNRCAYSWSFGVDTVKPSVETIQPLPDSFSNNPRLAIAARALDDGSGIAHMRLAVDGVVAQVVEGPEGIIEYVPDQDWPEKWLQVEVHVADLAGNAETLSWQWCQDRTPWRAEQVSPEPGQWTNTLAPEVMASLVDDLSGIDSGSVALMIGGTSVVATPDSEGVVRASVPVDEGLVTVLVAGLDRAGNAGSCEWEFLNDRTPPEVSVIAPEGVVNTSRPEMVFAIDDALSGVAEAILTVGGSIVDLAPVDGLASWTPDFDLAEGEQVVRLTVRDVAGNATAIDYHFFIELAPKLAPGQPSFVHAKPGQSAVTIWVELPLGYEPVVTAPPPLYVMEIIPPMSPTGIVIGGVNELDQEEQVTIQIASMSPDGNLSDDSLAISVGGALTSPITVGPRGPLEGYDFDKIQDAIEYLEGHVFTQSWVINVDGGLTPEQPFTYDEELDVYLWTGPEYELIIRSLSPAIPRLSTQGGWRGIGMSSGNCRIERLVVAGYDLAMSTQGDRVSLHDVLVEDCGSIHLWSNAGGLVSSCEFRDVRIAIMTACTVKNSLFIGVDDIVIDSYPGAGALFTNNTVYSKGAVQLGRVGLGFRNNIVSAESGGMVYGGENWGMDFYYNCWHGDFLFYTRYDSEARTLLEMQNYLGHDMGSISADPLFANVEGDDPAQWDFHLKSTAGRWDSTDKKWVIDASNSPCIDAGPEVIDLAEPAFNGGRINLGRYGGTPYASKSLAVPPAILGVETDHDADGVSLATGIIVKFSMAMDRQSVESALTLVPTTEFGMIWYDEETLAVLPCEALLASTQYQVTVTGEATSDTGVPLDCLGTGIPGAPDDSYVHSFNTQPALADPMEDTQSPVITLEHPFYAVTDVIGSTVGCAGTLLVGPRDIGLINKDTSEWDRPTKRNVIGRDSPWSFLLEDDVELATLEITVKNEVGAAVRVFCSDLHGTMARAIITPFDGALPDGRYYLEVQLWDTAGNCSVFDGKDENEHIVAYYSIHGLLVLLDTTAPEWHLEEWGGKKCVGERATFLTPGTHPYFPGLLPNDQHVYRVRVLTAEGFASAHADREDPSTWLLPMELLQLMRGTGSREEGYSVTYEAEDAAGNIGIDTVLVDGAWEYLYSWQDSLSVTDEHSSVLLLKTHSGPYLFEGQHVWASTTPQPMPSDSGYSAIRGAHVIRSYMHGSLSSPATVSVPHTSRFGPPDEFQWRVFSKLLTGIRIDAYMPGVESSLQGDWHRMKQFTVATRAYISRGDSSEYPNVEGKGRYYYYDYDSDLACWNPGGYPYTNNQYEVIGDLVRFILDDAYYMVKLRHGFEAGLHDMCIFGYAGSNMIASSSSVEDLGYPDRYIEGSLTALNSLLVLNLAPENALAGRKNTMFVRGSFADKPFIVKFVDPQGGIHDDWIVRSRLIEENVISRQFNSLQIEADIPEDAPLGLYSLQLSFTDTLGRVAEDYKMEDCLKVMKIELVRESEPGSGEFRTVRRLPRYRPDDGAGRGSPAIQSGAQHLFISARSNIEMETVDVLDVYCRDATGDVYEVLTETAADSGIFVSNNGALALSMDPTIQFNDEDAATFLTTVSCAAIGLDGKEFVVYENGPGTRDFANRLVVAVLTLDSTDPDMINTIGLQLQTSTHTAIVSDTLTRTIAAGQEFAGTEVSCTVTTVNEPLSPGVVDTIEVSITCVALNIDVYTVQLTETGPNTLEFTNTKEATHLTPLDPETSGQAIWYVRVHSAIEDHTLAVRVGSGAGSVNVTADRVADGIFMTGPLVILPQGFGGSFEGITVLTTDSRQIEVTVNPEVSIPVINPAFIGSALTFERKEGHLCNDIEPTLVNKLGYAVTKDYWLTYDDVISALPQHALWYSIGHGVGEPGKFHGFNVFKSSMSSRHTTIFPHHVISSNANNEYIFVFLNHCWSAEGVGAGIFAGVMNAEAYVGWSNTIFPSTATIAGRRLFEELDNEEEVAIAVAETRLSIRPHYLRHALQVVCGQEVVVDLVP